MEKGHLDNERLFASNWGLVTSKLYDRAFLEAQHARFDEDVTMCEDFLFNVGLYAEAERILILPQFVGYHYYMNAASLVQDKKSWSDGNRLIKFCRGYKKILETGLSHGFNMNSTIGELSVPIAMNMIDNPGLTMEQRLTIRDLLGPFIEMSYRITPNKIYPEKKANDFYQIPRSVIMHPERFADPSAAEGHAFVTPMKSVGSVRSEVLQQILEKNAGTDIGRRYDFMNIWTVDAYRAKVPLMSYEDYRPWIRLTTRTGESEIFTSEHIIAYYVDHDEDGNRMLLPCTRSLLERFVALYDGLLDGHDTFLDMESLPTDVSFNDQATLDTLSGLMLSEYHAKIYQRKRHEGTRLTAPETLLFPGEVVDTVYARLLFALRERDVDQIVALSAWELLSQLEELERCWPDLCDDIERGQIGEASGLPEKYREELASELRPDPERAAELRAVFSRGFDEPVLPKVWPRLARVVACGSGDYTIFADHLPLYTGTVPCTNGPFLLSVGILGEAAEGFNEYELAADGCFCEFLRRRDGAALPAEETEPGHVYEPVLTTSSGLYRYRTGALVYITRREGERIFFRPLTRLERGVALEGGGLLHGAHLYEPLKVLEREHGLRLTDCAFWGEDGKAVIMPEVSGHKGETEKARTQDREALGRELRALLQKELGDSTRMPEVELVFGVPGSHRALRDLQSQGGTVASDNIYPTHYVSSEAVRDFFRARVLK